MADQSELALYETLFQKRFTEEDPGFRTYLQTPAQAPPIVDSWSSRSRRNFQDRSQMGGRNEGWREGGRNEGWREGGRNEGRSGGRNEGWREGGRNEGWREGGRNEGWSGGRNEGWSGGSRDRSRDRREGYYGRNSGGHGHYQGGYDRHQGRDRPYH